jgi:hypothetical protein
VRARLFAIDAGVGEAIYVALLVEENPIGHCLCACLEQQLDRFFHQILHRCVVIDRQPAQLPLLIGRQVAGDATLTGPRGRLVGFLPRRRRGRCHHWRA